MSKLYRVGNNLIKIPGLGIKYQPLLGHRPKPENKYMFYFVFQTRGYTMGAWVNPNQTFRDHINYKNMSDYRIYSKTSPHYNLDRETQWTLIDEEYNSGYQYNKSFCLVDVHVEVNEDDSLQFTISDNATLPDLYYITPLLKHIPKYEDI